MRSTSSTSGKPAWGQLPASQAPSVGAAPAVPSWDLPTNACEAEKDSGAEDGRTEQLAETVLQEYAAVLQGAGRLAVWNQRWLRHYVHDLDKLCAPPAQRPRGMQARRTTRGLATRWRACGNTWRTQRRALQPAWCAYAPDSWLPTCLVCPLSLSLVNTRIQLSAARQ